MVSGGTSSTALAVGQRLPASRPTTAQRLFLNPDSWFLALTYETKRRIHFDDHVRHSCRWPVFGSGRGDHRFGNGYWSSNSHSVRIRGAAVACLDIEQEENEATAAAASALGAKPIALACAVRFRAEQAAAIVAVVEQWGRIDARVACAGVYVGGPLPDIAPERWDDLIAVNLTGVLVSNSLVSPIMIEQGRGAIVNISSMAGKTSWPNSAEYSATKSGVIGMTRSAAMELGPHGITVNAVCPGNTLTAMVQQVAAEIGATLDMTGDQWLAMRAEDTALKRLAERAVMDDLESQWFGGWQNGGRVLRQPRHGK